MTDITYPWDIWVANALENEEGGSLSAIRDEVIMLWLLKSGDPRPFYDWVLRKNHVPSQPVSRLIALMLLKGDSPGLSALEEKIGFQMKVSPDGPGRRMDLEADTRDWIISRKVNELMGDGLKQVAADAYVREWLNSEGLAVSLSTVEGARKKHRRQRGKK